MLHGLLGSLCTSCVSKREQSDCQVRDRIIMSATTFWRLAGMSYLEVSHVCRACVLTVCVNWSYYVPKTGHTPTLCSRKSQGSQVVDACTVLLGPSLLGSPVCYVHPTLDFSEQMEVVHLVVTRCDLLICIPRIGRDRNSGRFAAMRSS